MAERSPEEWKQLVNKFEWGDLDTRWETDEDLFLMKEFEWPDSGGKIVSSRDYVTMNSPRYFADRVIDTIKFSDEQITVEKGVDGEVMKDEKATPIEDFLRLNMRLADERLDRAEMLPNRAAAAGHMVVRGRAIRRTLVMNDGGDYIPDIQWYDPRYCKYKATKNGLAWAAPEMTRSGEEIEEEYQHTIKGKDEAKVLDLWTKDWNFVFIDGELIGNGWNHKLGYVPFSAQIVPIGGFIHTKGKYVKTIGESVFAPVRDLYPVFNKLLTILMTYTRLSIEGAYQYETADPEGVKEQVAKNKYPIEPGKVTVVEKGGGYRLIEIPDIKAAMQYLISQFEVGTQRATLPFLDYGQTPFELSGSAMLMIKGAGDIIYIPRMEAMANYYNHTAWMLIDQYKKGGLRCELGEHPFKHKMEKQKLDGDYIVKYKYIPNLPEKDLAQLHLASAMKELGASLDTIFRDYLQLGDPDGEAGKALMERAETAIPQLWMSKAVEAAIRNKEQHIADIIAAQFDMTIDQLMGGEVAGAGALPEKQRQPSALFERGGSIKQQGAMRYAQPPKNKEILA